jgi:hypothetical protein
MARGTAAGRRGQPTDTDALRPLLELLGQADEGREFTPEVAFAGGAVVLRRQDSAPVPATFGTLEELAALRERGQVAEVAPRVFRITAAGRQALREAQG